MTLLVPRSARPMADLAPAGGGQSGVSVEIAAAFTQALSSLEDLANKCRDCGIDPVAMITTMMFGGGPRAGALSPVSSVASLSGSPPLPEASDAEIARRSRDVIHALERADFAAVATTLAPGFVHFVDGEAVDREALLMTIMQRRSKMRHIASRTWDDERVVRKGNALVFTGRAHEVQGGNDIHGGYLYDGWYLVQWVPVGDAWRVQLLTRQEVATELDRWNDIFDQGRGFSSDPNRLLVETVKDRKPGAALELAMGQGRNALYLASQGWQVTGVDRSEHGMRRAREQAAERGLALETIVADIDEWDPGVDRFDLVTLLYAGDHAKWIAKIRASLRKGGLLIVEGWSKESPDSSIGFGDGQLAKLFEDYEILRDETVEDVPDWGRDHGTLVRFVARKR